MPNTARRRASRRTRAAPLLAFLSAALTLRLAHCAGTWGLTEVYEVRRRQSRRSPQLHTAL